MKTELKKTKATRRSLLLLADGAITMVVGAAAGHAWGLFPAVVAVFVLTTVFHLAGKRFGLN